MAELVYETHRMSHPQLPFIYWPKRTLLGRHGLTNWHESVEILRCTAGRGGIVCGGQDYPLSEDDLFIINANTPHRLYGSREGMEYLCLIVDNSFFAANGLDARTLSFRPLIRDSGALALFDAVAAAYAAFDEQALCAVADIRWSVLGLLRHLCTNHLSHAAQNADRAETYVMAAISYIRSHFAEPVTLDVLAQHVGLSKYHLSRRFRAYTGQTVIQVLNLTRCTRAEQLIREGSSVSAAATACGFENLSYFSRTYKKLMGKLPSQVER